MIIERGDIWSIKGNTDLLCVTTNAYVKRSGELVMGRGFALEVKNRLPWVARAAGQAIRNSGSKYGLLVIKIHLPNLVFGSMDTEYLAAHGSKESYVNSVLYNRIGLFQVKYRWSDPGDLDLISYSCSKLADYIDTYHLKKVDLVFPGIGNGRLERDQVLPIISQLPDSVHIWERN